MKRITKEIARDVAKRMVTDTIGKELTKVKTEASLICASAITEVTPKEVLVVFHNHKSYVNTCRRLTPCFNGERLREFEVNDLPTNQNSSWNRIIDCDEANFTILKKLDQELSKLELLRNDTLHQIEATLLSLCTPKKIKEHFPEAYDYLPLDKEEISSTICLPISNLQTILKKFENN